MEEFEVILYMNVQQSGLHAQRTSMQTLESARHYFDTVNVMMS